MFFLLVAGFATVASAQDLLTYNLRMGMKADAQVAIMQNLLISQGYLSSGNSTGNFGPLTYKAVRTFQSENSIDSTGFVGPLTRGKMNALIAGGATSAQYLPGCTSYIGYSSVSGMSCASAQQTAAAVTISPVQITSSGGTTVNLSSSYTANASGYYTVRFEYSSSSASFSYGTQSKIGQIVVAGSNNSFAASLVNLINGQTYFVRAVVEGPQGTFTTNVVQFVAGTVMNGNSNGGYVGGTYQNQSSAMTGQALVGTNPATSVSETSATLSGVYDGRGTDTQIYFQYWTGQSSYSSTTATSAGTGSGSVSFVLSNLTPGVTYSYRIVAMNAYGTTYGSTVSFTTSAQQSGTTGGYYYGGTGYYGTTGGTTGGTSSCTGSLPNIVTYLDGTSAAGTITTNLTQAPLITAKITTDCDASLKSVTFTATPSSLWTSYSNFYVYLNGSSTPTPGSFAGGTFTLSTPILINGGSYALVTLKANTGATGSGSAKFGVSSVTATSAAGVTNQYPASVTGNTLMYVLNATQFNGGTTGTIGGVTGTATTGVQGNTNIGGIH